MKIRHLLAGLTLLLLTAASSVSLGHGDLLHDQYGFVGKDPGVRAAWKSQPAPPNGADENSPVPLEVLCPVEDKWHEVIMPLWSAEETAVWLGFMFVLSDLSRPVLEPEYEKFITLYMDTIDRNWANQLPLMRVAWKHDIEVIVRECLIPYRTMLQQNTGVMQQAL